MIGPITTADYHTGGEPFRIVTGGAPDLQGRTVLERRHWAAEHLDDVRRLLVNEPRGHADMYGAFVTPPDDDGANLGVVFFHNEGYSTACGHGTIALVTWAIESGRVAGPEVVVDVPSGRLACTARLDADGRVASVAFQNVPSFVLARDVMVATSRGPVAVDVAFGGAFYGSVDLRSLGLAVSPAALPALIALQRELRPALEAALDVVHPVEPELRGIYGVIFWEPLEPVDGGLAQRNVTVFADGEVDRSPCGSGTSARLAILHGRGEIAVDAPFHHRSIVDSAFEARVLATADVAGRAAVVTEVEGSAYRTGEHTFTLDERDPMGTGFVLR
ncbi:MAG: proline racemase family protein [Candidatus Limnocylindrales bacterium]